MFSLVRSFARITSLYQPDCTIRSIVTNPNKGGWLTKYAKIVVERKKKEEYGKRRVIAEKYKDVVPLIECKNQELNHYKNITYAKFTTLPMASEGWYHRKSAGDYFIIHDASLSEEELRKQNEKLQSVPNFLRMEDFGYAEGEKSNEGLISFQDLVENADLLKAIDKMGITAPSEIQKRGIPPISAGRNVTLTAETGCGKTLAFLLPLIQHIAHYKKIKCRPNDALDSPFVIIISPSRELAKQTYFVAKFLSKYVDFTPKLILGGETSRMIQSHDYSEVDMVVGSLGGLSKFITKGVILTKHLRSVVLDEADSLLDEDFSEKLLHLLKKEIMIRPKLSMDDPGVQLIMVSATLPETLPDKLNTLIPLEDLVQICTEQHSQILPQVKQKFIRVNHSMRPSVLLDLVSGYVRRGEPVMIFR